MAKAVFTHADGSRYDDLPEFRYHFPRTYLGAAEQTVGDWIVYYEPRRIAHGSERTGGRQAYFATAFVERIECDPAREDHFYARIRPGDYISFPSPVPFRDDDTFYESGLRRADGKTSKGAFGRSVRLLPEAEFDAILTAGFRGVRDEMGAEDWAETDWAEAAPVPGFHDPATPFHRPALERLTRRQFRDAAFARQVKAAYGARCAMTGLRIVNGGGRPEVQAAHIQAVSAGGPDCIRNGLALSGTMHWLFDRGLVAVDDDYAILIAHDRVPEAVGRLIAPDRRLILPNLPALHPNPVYLARHRAGFKG